MSPNHGRRMSLLDAILMVGSAAIGLGLFELSHKRCSKAGSGSPTVASRRSELVHDEGSGHVLGHHGVLVASRHNVDILADLATDAIATAKLALDPRTDNWIHVELGQRPAIGLDHEPACCFASRRWRSVTADRPDMLSAPRLRMAS